LDCTAALTTDEKHSPEAYKIDIDQKGACTIIISTINALHRALATLLQLFYKSSNDELYCSKAPLTILDQPRFVHRGINLDIARNIIYPKDVKRVLDGMWLTKLNILHLHATDSQSWPIEIPSMPDLANKGAYDPSQIWTAENLDKVQKYGKSLGIQVYLEIDLPGHTASIHHARPDLIIAYNQQLWHEFSSSPPAGQLRLNSTAVDKFIKDLFEDLLPRIKPYSSIFSIGGDELNANCYQFEESISSTSKDIIRPFLQKFIDRVISIIETNGMVAMLWEEFLLEWDIKFPKNTIFTAWKSNGSLKAILEKGHCAIFGQCHYWYLDAGLGSILDPDPDNPDDPIKPPFHDWNAPYKNWRTVYTYNPLKDVDEKYHGRILGGEVHLWAELVDSSNLDGVLWPRAAAAAEVLWSGPTNKVDESVTRRFAEFRERLVLAGISSGMVQMLWLLQNKGSYKTTNL